MDLKEKLRQFESDFRAVPQPSRILTDAGIEKFVTGEEMVNRYGKYFCVRTCFSQNTRHGSFPFDCYRQSYPDLFRFVGKDKNLKGLDIYRSVFLDTETTGLAGGAGTVPFLVGLGYFSKNQFCVEQLFIRDYDEERPMLHDLAIRMKEFATIISYNGKAYDCSLLKSRFVLARMDSSFLDLPHLDLLFSARRLWRRRLGDCSLSHIEQKIIQFNRSEDVPGYMIPGLYFKYLRSKNGEPLKPVFQHNRWDIVTLLVLAGLLLQIFQDHKTLLKHPLDLYSLGRSFADMEEYQKAVICYKEALNSPLETQEQIRIMGSLGLTFKKLKQWMEAVEVWKGMIGLSAGTSLPYEELAKHYEHRDKNYSRAIAVVQDGLKRLELTGRLYSDFHDQNDRDNLEYRLHRLRQKLSLNKE